jgi:hypothetical protein
MFHLRTLLHSGAAYLLRRAAAADVTLSLAISFCKQSGGPLLTRLRIRNMQKVQGRVSQIKKVVFIRSYMSSCATFHTMKPTFTLMGTIIETRHEKNCSNKKEQLGSVLP